MYPKHRYISNEVYRLLVDKRCSIVCDLDLENREVPPNYPTQDQVIDWLEQEHKIFISTFPLYTFPVYDSNKVGCPFVNKYGVDIKDKKGIEYGCKNNYENKEEAINNALMYVLNNMILTKRIDYGSKG